MAENIVEVTAGTGTKLHSWSKTVGANTVHDEFTLPGEYPLAGYVAVGSAVSMANASDDIAQLMAGSSLNVRVRRIRVEQTGLITSAAASPITVARLTTAGTAGSSVTPSKMDNADAASGATAQQGVPTATKGTIGATLLARTLFPVQTAGTAGVSQAPFWEWVQQPNMKPLIIPAGTSNGLCLRNGGARAGLTVNWEIEFVETAFV